MRCHYCDLAFKGSWLRSSFNTKKTFDFCDVSCERAWIREDSRAGIEFNYKTFSTITFETDASAAEKKLARIDAMLNLSLLQRKPRWELIKLEHLYKKCICDVIDEFLEAKKDKEVFVLGENFKVNYTTYINAWAAPEQSNQ